MSVRLFRPVYSLFISVVVVLCWAVVANAIPAGTQDGELVADGAWCWFQDPRAVHYVGTHDRTYIAYVTSQGNVEIVSQDAGTAVLTHTTLQADFQKDDHAAPGILVRPDGHIAVFFSKHTGDALYSQVSTRPEDITSFGPPEKIATTSSVYGLTYGNPIYLPAEDRTYVFFRGQNAKPNVIWSTDFKTWSAPRTVVTPPSMGPNVRPYVKYSSNGLDTILLSFTDGHPRDEPTNSIYTMILQGGVFRAVDGTVLASLTPDQDGLPALPVVTSSLTKVYDGSGPRGKAWVWSTAFDQQGRPVIVFATFPSETDHRYWYARWTGETWVTTELTGAGGTIQTAGNEPDYSGGIELDSNDPSRVYTSRYVGGQWEIQRWATSDGGLSFGQPVSITSGSTQKNIRPVVPWGPPGEIEVLWMAGRYDDWEAGYDTQLRELTSGRAPTTTRISVSSPTIGSEQAMSVSGRVVQGYLGSPVSGALATLYSQSASQGMTPVATATTDRYGLVGFPVTQRADTTYQVRFAGDATWGLSTSPSTAVRIAAPSATRVSVDRTTSTPQTLVGVGIRAVSAATGRGLTGVPVQLWQRVGTGPWALRARLTADGQGLATASLRPNMTVTYQGRFPGAGEYAPSQSTTAQVVVRNAAPSATRVSVDRTTSTPQTLVRVGIRAVSAATGRGLTGVPVQLWQRVGTGPWALRARFTADGQGLATASLRPNMTVTYQGRFPGAGAYAPSQSTTAQVVVRQS